MTDARKLLKDLFTNVNESKLWDLFNSPGSQYGATQEWFAEAERLVEEYEAEMKPGPSYTYYGAMWVSNRQPGLLADCLHRNRIDCLIGSNKEGNVIYLGFNTSADQGVINATLTAASKAFSTIEGRPIFTHVGYKAPCSMTHFSDVIGTKW
jgi:hypothetical protein